MDELHHHVLLLVFLFNVGVSYSKLCNTGSNCESKYSVTLKNFFACENKGNKKIKCEAGSVIEVLYANYGRTTAKKCGKSSITNCRASNSLTIIKSLCQNKPKCQLSPDSSVFGDPCSGVPKYLEVRFKCKKEQCPVGSNCELVACDGEGEQKITCREGSAIKVQYANYGRTSVNNRCGSSEITDCKAKKSQKKVKELCHGKQVCKLSPDSSVFGDPCTGVEKYLDVRYKCKKGCDQGYAKVGCYQDKVFPERPYPVRLLSHRNPYVENATLIDWNKWPESLSKLACNCASLAKKAGHAYFGLQYYGECWSGPGMNYSRDGPSKECVGGDFKECKDDDTSECVGKAFSNYIYKVEVP